VKEPQGGDNWPYQGKFDTVTHFGHPDLIGRKNFDFLKFNNRTAVIFFKRSVSPYLSNNLIDRHEI